MQAPPEELVARAIAGSRYVRFDPQRERFEDPPAESFLPINLAALSPALIESELFGHRQGSFNYEKKARRLGMDRRTVKAKVDAFLARTTG